MFSVLWHNTGYRVTSLSITTDDTLQVFVSGGRESITVHFLMYQLCHIFVCGRSVPFKAASPYIFLFSIQIGLLLNSHLYISSLLSNLNRKYELLNASEKFAQTYQGKLSVMFICNFPFWLLRHTWQKTIYLWIKLNYVLFSVFPFWKGHEIMVSFYF